MKPLFLPACILCFLITATATKAEYLSELSLRYGRMNTGVNEKWVAGTSVEILKTLKASGDDSVGLCVSHYDWSEHGQPAEIIYTTAQTGGSDPLPVIVPMPIFIYPAILHSRRDAVMAAWRHQWTLRPRLELSATLRTGGNTGKQHRMVEMGSAYTLTASPYQYPDPNNRTTHSSFAFCAEAELRLRWRMSERWSASMGVLGSKFSSHQSDGDLPALQGFQSTTGIECLF